MDYLTHYLKTQAEKSKQKHKWQIYTMLIDGVELISNKIFFLN